MTDERRYGEDEVAAIFEAASTPQARTRGAASSTDGLTLDELKSIGREIGVPPDRIAEAALALDRERGVTPRRSFLGMPIAVGRVVDLPRAPSDREWEMLVAELRRTFGAQGRLGTGGTIREWWNGNLHAVVEPTEDGYHLRLGTMKSDAAAINRMGIGLIAMAAVLLVVGLLIPEFADKLSTSTLFTLIGGAALGYNALRLPRWAQIREEQMRHIESRARALISGPAPSEQGESTD